MLGVRYLTGRRVQLSFGVTYDNTRAILFRPGITLDSPF
jgi:hypothetical protein